MNNDHIIRELLDTGLDDWVPVDRIIWLAREEEESTNVDFRDKVISTLEEVTTRGLAEIGEIGSTGFEAWHGSVEERLARAKARLQELDWVPRLDGFWVANTPRGDAHVRDTNAN